MLQQPNHKLQPAEIDQLVTDYVAGMCPTELGERYDLHRQTAKAHLLRRGVEIRSEQPTLTPAEVDHAVELYAQGLGLMPVSQRLGVSANTVKRALLTRGVTLKTRGYWRLGD